MSKGEKKTYPFWHVSPHVVILGAGASKAAFPNGDKNGLQLPLMDNLIEVLNLYSLLEKKGIKYRNRNFEDLYDELSRDDRYSDLVLELNNRVREYFSEFQIPDEVTIYDELILSLRNKDKIFSFNWDPLLLQAYRRHSEIESLPLIHFLHGNVAVGICEKDKTVGFIKGRCSKCGNTFEPVQLLYPVKDKNYKTNPFIRSEWDVLEWVLENSFLLTIFGYSAPKTDVVAKEMMKKAWDSNSRKDFNQIEIIDIKTREELKKTWSEFIVRHHFGCFSSIRNTLCFQYPRRSSDAFGSAIMRTKPWHENKLPNFKKLEDLHNWFKPLIKQEKEFDKLEKTLTDINAT